MPEIKANLVRLSIRIFPNTRQDPAISNEVRKSKSLGVGAGKWIKHIFPEEAFKEIRECGGQARRRHYDLTLPWEDGLRLLPVAAHDGYKSEMEIHRTTFWAHVAAFEKKYDDWIAQSKVMHGKSFERALYPDWRTMQQKYFGLGVEYDPVPKAAHFLTAGLAAEAVAEMRQDLEQLNEQRVTIAVKDTWNRVLTPVQAIAEKLVGKDPIFRNSLITNVKEITALVPALNLTGDVQLSKIAKEIELKFANLDPEVLRNDKTVRKEIRTAAKQLAARFGQIGKRRFA